MGSDWPDTISRHKQAPPTLSDAELDDLIARGSTAAVGSNDEPAEAAQDASGRTKRSRRTRWLWSAAAAIVVLGAAVFGVQSLAAESDQRVESRATATPSTRPDDVGPPFDDFPELGSISDQIAWIRSQCPGTKLASDYEMRPGETDTELPDWTTPPTECELKTLVFGVNHATGRVQTDALAMLRQEPAEPVGGEVNTCVDVPFAGNTTVAKRSSGTGAALVSQRDVAGETELDARYTAAMPRVATLSYFCTLPRDPSTLSDFAAEGDVSFAVTPTVTAPVTTTVTTSEASTPPSATIADTLPPMPTTSLAPVTTTVPAPETTVPQLVTTTTSAAAAAFDRQLALSSATARTIIGMDIDDATRVVTSLGLQIRVIEPGVPYTVDFRPVRVNVELSGQTIIKAYNDAEANDQAIGAGG